MAWAAKSYEEFHGKAPTLHKVSYEPPKAAVLLGDLASFAYIPPKGSERATTDEGQKIVWDHTMGDTGYLPFRIGKRPRILIAKDGTLVIIGGSQRLSTSRGVVG